MNYILTLLSIFLETGKNVFSNIFSKNVLKNEADIYKFNACMYCGSALILVFLMKTFGISVYSLISAIIFALITTTSQYFYLKALNLGSLAFSTFFSGSGLIIPTICGIIFWNEKLNINQIIALPVLITAMAMVITPDNKKKSVKWLIMSLLTLVFTGLIGVAQSVHQSSPYKEELIPFLFYSFIFMVIFNAVVCMFYGKTAQKATYKIKSKASFTAIISGVFMGIVNVLNLYLSGAMSKIIFFPMVNGGLIFISLLAAVIIFKEKLTVRQWIGIVFGIGALCFLGI